MNNINNFDAGFIIAMIEGEGSFSLIKKISKKKGKFSLQPIISTGNYEHILLETMKNNLKVGAIHPSGKGWVYQITGMETIIKVLTWMIPKLLTKRKKTKAILLKEYCESRLEKNHKWSGKDIYTFGGRGPPYSDKDLEYVQKIKNTKGSYCK